MPAMQCEPQISDLRLIFVVYMSRKPAWLIMAGCRNGPCPLYKD